MNFRKMKERYRILDLLAIKEAFEGLGLTINQWSQDEVIITKITFPNKTDNIKVSICVPFSQISQFMSLYEEMGDTLNFTKSQLDESFDKYLFMWVNTSYKDSVRKKYKQVYISSDLGDVTKNEENGYPY